MAQEITAALIAPCGMNCRLCSSYQRSKNSCGGCRTECGSLPAHCRNCGIRTCSHLASGGFCVDCALYPCPPLKRLNTRYQKAYGIQLTDNLTFIRSCGIDAFLIREARRWSCTYCGAIGCIHEKKCPGCGRESTERNINMDFLLREWRPEDAISVARCADNEKIARNLRDVFPCPYTLQDASDYINSCIAADENRQLCRAIAVNGEAAGSIGLFLGGDVYRKSAELGYWLAEDYWGRGVMTAAVKQLCAEAFSRWDIARIYAEPFARNTGSRRVLEKAGFTLEGIMKKGVYKNGALEDYCMYALLRP